MKINYILSDTTKSATTAALKEVVKKAEGDVFGDIIVIVPETKSVIIEKELLELSKNGAFANIFVYSFVRLINRMGFVSADKIVSKQTCVLLLKKIIYNNINNLKCYKKTAKSLGFAEKIYDTIAQFKSSGVTANDLELSLSTKSEALRAKLEDIVFLYKEYEKILGEGLFDDLDKLALLSKFAKESDVIKNADVFVVGFDNITYEMQVVLKNIAINAKSTTFSSVYFNEKRTDKYIQSNELYFKFKHIADECKIPYIPTMHHAVCSGDFYNIKNYLFSLEKKVVESKGNVQIFSAKNKDQEIEFVANTILSEIKNGKRFKDIGVFVNGLSDNSQLIQKCFERFGIPYYIKQEYDLLNHFYIKFIQSAFEVELLHLSYENVLEFVSNVLFEANDYSAFHNFVFETGINYSSFLNGIDESLSQREDYLSVKGTFDKFHNFYNAFKSKISTAKTIADFCAVIDFVNQHFGVFDKLEKFAKFEEEQGLIASSEITSKIYEQVENFNKSLVNFLGGMDVSLDEFVQIYFSGFSSVKLNLSPATIDCVVIDDSTDSFWGIKDLFVFDAVEGKFPAKIQDSGIILDEELEDAKNILNKAIEPTTKQINDRENFKAYEVLLEPTEKLFVSFSTKNQDGSITKPSRLVLKIDSLFGSKIITDKFDAVDFVNHKHHEEVFARHIGDYFSNKVLKNVVEKDYLIAQKNLSEPFKKHLESLNFNSDEFFVSSVDGLYFYGDKTSISQLEQYFACPYKFFAKYGLRLKENKNFKANSLDIGNLIHRVAELFVKKIKSVESLDGEDFKKYVENLLKQAIEELEINTTKNKALIKFLSDECVRLCEYLINEYSHSGFKTKENFTEFEFKGENAVVLNLENGRTIKIEGKIDRVDEFGDYVRIVDYKTGSIKSELSSVYYGNKIQLVSYLLAIQSMDNKNVAGLFYLPVHSDFVKTEKDSTNMYQFDGYLLDDINVIKHMDYTLSFEHPESCFVPLKIKKSKENVNTNNFEISGSSQRYMSKDDFDALKNYVVELCKQGLSEILSGYIEPSPVTAKGSETPKECDWCKFKGLCGLSNAKNNSGRTLDGKISISNFKNISKEEA